MKGVLFSVNKESTTEKALKEILKKGLYSVWQSPRKLKDGSYSWHTQAGAFADYLTLSPGDKVFFFRNRKIYGIGKLISVPEDSRNPGLLNYPNSDLPIPPILDERTAIFTDSRWKDCRVVVPFIEGPILFEKGIDMDEVLSSPFANFFWGLRFWEGFSFKQLGEEETRILCEIFLRRFNPTTDKIQQDNSKEELIKAIKKKFHGTFSAKKLIARNTNAHLRANGRFKVENWLHAIIIEQLKENKPDSLLYDKYRRNVFREVPASPPKPPMYADRIDVLTTSSHPSNKDMTVNYTVIEVKKDTINPKNPKEFNQTVSQVTKYVDFIAKNYTEGNYGVIKAIYIAKGFSKSFKESFRESQKPAITGESEITSITRSYVLDPHETKPIRIWNDFQLIEYSWNEKKQELELRLVEIEK